MMANVYLLHSGVMAQVIGATQAGAMIVQMVLMKL